MTNTVRAVPPEPVAPWAEAVPTVEPVTEAAFLAQPDDGWQYELVRGVLVRMPPSGKRATRIARRLSARLGDYVDERGLGEVTGEQGGYRLAVCRREAGRPHLSCCGRAKSRLAAVLRPKQGRQAHYPSGKHVLSDRLLAPGTDLAPDVGFIRADRLPPLDSSEYDTIADGAPDLAVEVASPNQWRPGMAKKAMEYLEAGTRLVWVIWPRWQEVYLWRVGDDAPTTLTVADELDGEDVVPGFTYPVADLFR